MPESRFVRFPPRWRNVLVPLSPPRASALGVTLYTASKPLPWAAQSVLWCLARIGGGRMLPGPREAWTPPFDTDVAAHLLGDWAAAVGRAPDGIAIYQRIQTARAVLTLLVCAGAASMLVRVRREPDALAQERRISEAAGHLGPSGFRVPQLVGHGEAAGWHWTGYEVMARRPHRPRYRLPDGAADEIAALVESAVPRPVGTPSDWSGAHLDVSPWNLRRGGGRTWLIDWEDAGWAPQNADAVYLAATVSAMRSDRGARLPVIEANPQAAAYWHAIIDARVPNANEAQLRERMLVLLDRSAPGHR